MGFLDIIAKPLGQFLFYIYDTVAFHRYGVALIIFTIIIRAAMLPLTIKSYRSNAKIQELQPQMQEVQKRYKNDKEKLNQELMNLYKENQVNPAGGCLPILIQMPIFLSLWQVISKPLTYMFQWEHGKINEYVTKLNIPANTGYPELAIVDKMGDKILDMNFLGLNLGLIPTIDFRILFSNMQYLALLIIPIIAVATTYISSKISMVKTVSQNNSNAAMQNSMLIIAPLMTLIFSFTFPAGLGLYWISGNIVTILQQLYINKHILKKKEVVNK